MTGRHIQIPPDEHDQVWMIKNLIEHLKRELMEEKTDLKRLIVLKSEIAKLKETLDELE